MTVRTKAQKDAINDFIKHNGFKNMSKFAESCGLTRMHFSAYYNGRCDPSVRTLLRWAIILKCDLEELIELFYPEEYHEYLYS